MHAIRWRSGATDSGQIPVGHRHALVDRASDDATVRASGSKEEAAGGAVWRSVAIRSGAGQACRPGSQRSLRCGLRQHAQKQQSAAAGASLVGRQATLRGCDGYAHYPLAQWRNGQWADPMLAHAGAEAVRLVPFSSLLRLALLPNTAISMALAAVPGACDGSQRCADSSSVREESATMRRSRVLSGRSVHARSVRRTREELAVFGGAFGAC